MSQWASAFAESALHLSKTAGDLAGPCAFAVLMGTARAFYGKHSDTIPLKKMMFLCAVLCVASYLLASLSSNPYFGLIGCAVCGFSVGIMWPGTISISAHTLTRGGTAMFALLALAGDLGGALGPGLVGVVSQEAGGDLKTGILLGCIFPVIMVAGLLVLSRKRKHN
jgi:MFS family permease